MKKIIAAGRISPVDEDNIRVMEIEWRETDRVKAALVEIPQKAKDES